LNRSFDFFWIDAFTESPFSGNPAAVCVLEHEVPDATLQNIAREFNLSETVFISRRSSGYDIRWFTPTLEVDLVGHATLAAAYVIMAELEPGRTAIEFHSRRSGLLRAYGDRTLVSIELPADALRPCEVPAALLAGLGRSPARVLKGRHYVAVMSDPAEVLSIHPNLPELMKLDRPTIAVTAPDTETDYVLRFFAPANGVPEDPVSGVAQCSLVPFWAGELKRSKLRSRQLSARGGMMDCELQGDRVVISGPCTSIARGRLDIAALS
jgi:PhzF family phenazine biosynthesis protein